MTERYASYSRAQLDEKLRHELDALRAGAGSEHERLAHALLARQLELEIENRDLRAASETLQSARDSLEAVSGHAPGGILYLDAQGRVCAADAGTTAWGRKHGHPLIGEALETLVHSADRWKLDRFLNQMYAGRSPTAVELRLLASEDLCMRLDMGHVVTDRTAAAGPLYELRWADTTLQRQVEADARRHISSVSRAARLNALGEMASGIAHELSQPLSAIVAYARAGRHLLQTDGEGARAELEQSLEKVAQQAERASEVIRRIRGFVRKEPPRCGVCTVTELLQHAFTIVDDDIRDAGITVRVIEEAPDQSVWVDAVFIEQVMVNLLRNAIEAIQAGSGGNPEIVVRIDREEHDWVEVSFMDNGEGVVGQDPEQWFMPFATNRRGSLGLGLSLSRSLVEAHGGHLWAEQVGNGAVALRFTVPATEARA